MPIEMPASFEAHRPLRGQSPKLVTGILAAGVARRLEPISKVIAKPAFPLGGKIPILESWIRLCVLAGIPDIGMNLHVAPESVKNYFHDGTRFLAHIEYVEEKEPSGTLGGVIKILDKLSESNGSVETLIVPSGDIVSGMEVDDLEEMYFNHKRNGAAITLMLAPIPWDRRKDFGTAILKGMKPEQHISDKTYARIETFLEKDPDSPSNLNNASLYFIETQILKELKPYLTPAKPDQPDPVHDFGKHVFPGILGSPTVPYLHELLEKYKDNLFGYVSRKPWFDVGNKRDYLAVNRAVLDRKIPLELPFQSLPWGWLGYSSEINFHDVKIITPVVIGNNCFISPGATIGPYTIVGDGWTIRPGATVANTVLWEDYDHFRTLSGYTPHRHPRIINDGISVNTTVIVGGLITENFNEVTIDYQPNGNVTPTPIDWIPGGPRA